jgi:hypothetical protein
MKRIALLLASLLIPALALGAVTATTQKVQYTCAGTTGPFTFAFPITATTDLNVVVTDASANDTTLVLTTNYTVSAVNNDFAQGGSITLVSACTSGYTLTIKRYIPATQPSHFTENMPTLYKTFERALDRLTMILQDSIAGLVDGVFVPSSEWPVSDIRNTAITDSLTGGILQTWSQGTSSAPSTSKYPILYVEKWAGSNDGTTHQDQGAAVFKTISSSGASFRASLTGSIFRDGGTGDLVGIIGWAENNIAPTVGSIYGMWAFAHNAHAGASGTYIHGIELDVSDRGGDAGHVTLLGTLTNKTGSIGAWAAIPTTNDNNATLAYGVTPNSDYSGKWHTGFYTAQDSIVPTGVDGLNEAIYLVGGSAANKAYSGIRAVGYLYSGMDLSGATITSNAAIKLDDAHRIYFLGTENTYLGRSVNSPIWAIGSTEYLMQFGNYLNLEEDAAPSAPAANKLIIFAVPDGGGKTKLMVQFQSGAAQQIAIEP